MDLNEAINLAEQMKNHYQAFSKIQEVLDAVRNYSNAIGFLKKEIESLQSLVDQKKVALMEMESSLAERKKQDHDRLLALENEYKSKHRILEEKYDQRVKEIGSSIDLTTKKLTALDADYANKLNVLKQEEAALTERIGQLKKMATELKNKLAGVAD